MLTVSKVVGGGVVDLEQPLDAFGIKNSALSVGTPKAKEHRPDTGGRWIPPEADLSSPTLPRRSAAGNGGVFFEIGLAHLLCAPLPRSAKGEGRAAFGPRQLHLARRRGHPACLELYDQRLAALPKRVPRGRASCCRDRSRPPCGRRDAELGEVVDHRGPVARVPLPMPLDAVVEVESKVAYESVLRVRATPSCGPPSVWTCCTAVSEPENPGSPGSPMPQSTSCFLKLFSVRRRRRIVAASGAPCCIVRPSRVRENWMSDSVPSRLSDHHGAGAARRGCRRAPRPDRIAGL